jgi:hypothetical protein
MGNASTKWWTNNFSAPDIIIEHNSGFGLIIPT